MMSFFSRVIYHDPLHSSESSEVPGISFQPHVEAGPHVTAGWFLNPQFLDVNIKWGRAPVMLLFWSFSNFLYGLVLPCWPALLCHDWTVKSSCLGSLTRNVCRFLLVSQLLLYISRPLFFCHLQPVKGTTPSFPALRNWKRNSLSPERVKCKEFKIDR